jgi:hypothetical protein
MHPRTLVILVVLTFGLALVGRFVVARFGLLPISEEAVLKKAKAVSVTYYSEGQNKTLVINDRAEVQELLDTLHLLSEDYYGYSNFGVPRLNTVIFVFPDNSLRNCGFHGPEPFQLGDNMVDRAFYLKLCELVSRHEGRPVDVLNIPPVPVPPPNFQAWPNPDQE